MTKKLLLLHALLLCFGIVRAQQQNEKIIFPQPQNITKSTGQFARPTSDGGHILTGWVDGPQTNASIRLIKLNAEHEVEWDKVEYFQDPNSFSNPVVFATSPALQHSNGTYAVVFQNDSTSTDMLLIDGQGNITAQKDLFAWTNGAILIDTLPGGGYLIGRTYSGFDLIHVNAAGDVTAQYPMGNIGVQSATRLSNGDVLLCSKSNNKIIFRRVTTTGTVIWQTQPSNDLIWWDNLAPVPVALPDGSFSVLSYQSQTSLNRIFNFDAQGNLLGLSPEDVVPATMIPNYIAYTPAGKFLLSGRTVTNRGFVAQLNAAGTAVEWAAESPEDGQEHLTYLNAIPTADGWAVGAGSSTGDKFGFMSVTANTGVFVNYISGYVIKDNDESCARETGEPGVQATYVRATNGTETFQDYSASNGFYRIAVPAGDYTLSVQTNQPFFFLCPTTDVTASFPPNASATTLRDMPLQSQELIHQITGKVRLDANNNCISDPDEQVLEDWKVQMVTGLYVVHADTDADGNYSFFVPDGDYTIKLLPYNQNYGVCTPDEQTVSLAGPDPQTATLDFTAKANFNCALMRGEITRWNMRPCSTTILRIHYRNVGTALAEETAVQVTLDPMLTYEDATLVPASIDGQVLTFETGDVPPTPGSEWLYFDIHATVDCAAQIGEQLCVTVKVAPDTVCYQSQEWSGAIVEASGTCENDDQAIFTIRNVGNAPNSEQLDYTIIEDQIVLKTGTFQLNPGESINDTVPGSGKPLTIIAQQEPGFPGDTSVVFHLYNCGEPNSNPGNGFGGPSGPFFYQECFPVTASFDPNDKDARPEGFGADHVVHPGTPLEYRIRFQNTGNDTAFLVVIRDTLSQAFDFSSIEPRGSSHPFDFALIGDSILHFTFENILLPDSATNPLGSQGFIEFSVRPKKDLPLGTKVSNKAAIYFDHNLPVITNTVLRTYGEVIMVSVDDPDVQSGVRVKVYPNPFIDVATFELPDLEDAGTHSLELSDASGRLLSTLQFNGNKCTLTRGDLPAGVLFWTIRSNGARIARGKMVAVR
jgi:uncharacterized repeat protein (TIGR01451 family)